MTQAFQRGRDRPLFRARSRHQTMGRSNRNQTFERAQWRQVDCDHGCRASLLESATALRNSASFRDYGPSKGGQQTFEQVRNRAAEPESKLLKSPFSRNYRNRLSEKATIQTCGSPSIVGDRIGDLSPTENAYVSNAKIRFQSLFMLITGHPFAFASS